MAQIKRYKVAEPYLKCSTSIGESLHYDAPTNVLYFLDCDRHELHSIELAKGPSSHKVIKDLQLKQHKIVDLEHSNDQWLCGGKYGFGLMDKRTGKSKYIVHFWSDQSQGKNFTSNDGGVDSRGRFWLGMIGDPFDYTNSSGGLWRLDPDLTPHRIISSGVYVPNGISWSLDDRTMYTTDSQKQTIFAHDFDAAAGTISNSRVFFCSKSPSLRGSPDGHAMDEHGYLWVALFGGGRVVRVSPQGEVVAEVSIPTRAVTDVAFVGEDIFITTAKDWSPKKYPESVKMQGDLFRVHVGVKGRPLNKFGLAKEFLSSAKAKL